MDKFVIRVVLAAGQKKNLSSLVTFLAPLALIDLEFCSRNQTLTILRSVKVNQALKKNVTRG